MFDYGIQIFRDFLQPERMRAINTMFNGFKMNLDSIQYLL